MYVDAWYGTYSGTYSLDDGNVLAVLEQGQTAEQIGQVLANGQFDGGTDAPPGNWQQTSEEADAAANFCATGTFTPPTAN